MSYPRRPGFQERSMRKYKGRNINNVDSIDYIGLSEMKIYQQYIKSNFLTFLKIYESIKNVKKYILKVNALKTVL